MWKASHHRSGARISRGLRRPVLLQQTARLALVVVLLAVQGCNYSFRAGSGFPPHIRTIAILPLENETERFELTQEVHEALLRELPGALGVQPAGEDAADAVLRGTVRRYSVDSPIYRPGAAGTTDVVERQVTMGLAVEILDVRNNVILWEDRSISVQGQYLEASQTEETGRVEAINRIVQRIVDGAQSNW